MVGISDIPIMNHKLAVSNYFYSSLSAEKCTCFFAKNNLPCKKRHDFVAKNQCVTTRFRCRLMVENETTKPSSILLLFVTFVNSSRLSQMASVPNERSGIIQGHGKRLQIPLGICLASYPLNHWKNGR